MSPLVVSALEIINDPVSVKVADDDLTIDVSAPITIPPFDPVTGEPGVSVELFRRPSAGQIFAGRTTGFDVSPDGQRFYLVIPQQQERASTVTLVLNWRRELERVLGK